MRRLIEVAALILPFAAFATNYGPYSPPNDPNLSQAFVSNPATSGTYGLDTLVFSPSPQTCFGGNGTGEYCWTYDGQMTLSIQGAFYETGYKTVHHFLTTMPTAPTLSMVNPDGSLTPLPLTYVPINGGNGVTVDSWKYQGPMPLGTYLATGISGTSCSNYWIAQSECLEPGGSSWKLQASPGFTYCSPYTSPPCASGGGDEQRSN